MKNILKIAISDAFYNPLIIISLFLVVIVDMILFQYTELSESAVFQPRKISAIIVLIFVGYYLSYSIIENRYFFFQRLPITKIQINSIKYLVIFFHTTIMYIILILFSLFFSYELWLFHEYIILLSVFIILASIDGFKDIKYINKDRFYSQNHQPNVSIVTLIGIVLSVNGIIIYDGKFFNNFNFESYNIFVYTVFIIALITSSISLIFSSYRDFKIDT